MPIAGEVRFATAVSVFERLAFCNGFLKLLADWGSEPRVVTLCCLIHWIKVLIFILCIFSTVRLCWRSLKLFFLDCHAADKLLKSIWMMLKYKVHQRNFLKMTLQLVVWRSNLSIKSTTMVQETICLVNLTTTTTILEHGSRIIMVTHTQLSHLSCHINASNKNKVL